MAESRISARSGVRPALLKFFLSIKKAPDVVSGACFFGRMWYSKNIGRGNPTKVADDTPITSKEQPLTALFLYLYSSPKYLIFINVKNFHVSMIIFSKFLKSSLNIIDCKIIRNFQNHITNMLAFCTLKS